MNSRKRIVAFLAIGVVLTLLGVCYYYVDNLEDPNERGYDVIRRLFLIEMSKVANQLK